MNKLLFLFIPILLVLNACDEGSSTSKKEVPKSPRIRKKVSLVSPVGNQLITRGSSLTLEVQHKDQDGIIDSLFALLEGEKYPFSGNQLELSGIQSIGKLSIQVVAYTQGNKETLYPNVTVLPEEPPQSYAYQVLETYPHDTNAWTQGLFTYNGDLYESTGQHGESSLSRIDLSTGEVQAMVNLDQSYFGEGSTIWNDQIFYLTWTSQIGFVYDLSFNQLRTFNYPTEGWGITTYGDTLIMSDGTENIHFIDPKDFSTLKTLQVYDHKGKVDELNELEMIDGILFANVWGTEDIVMIDPSTGIVTGRIDFSGLYTPQRANRYDKSLNGIATDESGSIFVTGKLWPSLYKVSITKKDNPL